MYALPCGYRKGRKRRSMAKNQFNNYRKTFKLSLLKTTQMETYLIIKELQNKIASTQNRAKTNQNDYDSLMLKYAEKIKECEKLKIKQQNAIDVLENFKNKKPYTIKLQIDNIIALLT